MISRCRVTASCAPSTRWVLSRTLMWRGESGSGSVYLCEQYSNTNLIICEFDCPCLPLSRQRPALGECLAHLAAAMPVAYLEPHLNEYNSFSVYTTKTPRERGSEYPANPVICSLSTQDLYSSSSTLSLIFSFFRLSLSASLFLCLSVSHCHRSLLIMNVYPASWGRWIM